MIGFKFREFCIIWMESFEVGVSGYMGKHHSYISRISFVSRVFGSF